MLGSVSEQHSGHVQGRNREIYFDSTSTSRVGKLCTADVDHHLVRLWVMLLRSE